MAKETAAFLKKRSEASAAKRQEANDPQKQVKRQGKKREAEEDGNKEESHAPPEKVRKVAEQVAPNDSDTESDAWFASCHQDCAVVL